MEWFLRWLDECDDLLRVLHVRGRRPVATLLLFLVFVAIAGAMFVLGAPDLAASP
jgi:hypothetical protein